MTAAGGTIELYTDGACLGNPGPGGFAVVVLVGTDDYSGWAGADPWTTNNRMELMAAATALEQLAPTARVLIHTDSSYVATGFTKWLPGWKRNGWRGRDGAVANQDLWKKLASAAARHDGVEFRHVRGHNGHRWNELADELASAEARAARDGAHASGDVRRIGSCAVQGQLEPVAGDQRLNDAPLTLF